jgi:hypothetical protein
MKLRPKARSATSRARALVRQGRMHCALRRSTRGSACPAPKTPVRRCENARVQAAYSTAITLCMRIKWPPWSEAGMLDGEESGWAVARRSQSIRVALETVKSVSHSI